MNWKIKGDAEQQRAAAEQDIGEHGEYVRLVPVAGAGSRKSKEVAPFVKQFLW